MFVSYADYLKTSLTTVNKKYTEGYCEGLNFIRETVQRIFLKEIIRPMETIRTFLKPVIDLQGTGAQIKRLRKLNGFSVHELQQLV